jgi:hypothetical protein
VAEPEDVDFTDELRRVLLAEPFHPFVIVMTSGARYEVTDRLQCAVGRTTFTYYPPKSGHFCFSLRQISLIEVLETAG